MPGVRLLCVYVVSLIFPSSTPSTSNIYVVAPTTLSHDKVIRFSSADACKLEGTFSEVNTSSTSLQLPVTTEFLALTLYECLVFGVNPLCKYCKSSPLLITAPSTAISYPIAPVAASQETVTESFVADASSPVGVAGCVVFINTSLQFPIPP